MKQPYVIIGNSAAAIGCVEGIRRVDPSGDILLISAEPYHAYSRPLISYLLSGKTDRQRMQYRPEDFYTKNHCNALLGARAAAIDPADKTVTLHSGERLAYEKLLVATGSRPLIPPIEGLDSVPAKGTFQSLDDALALEQAVTRDSRVLILGAGLIGLKCAEGLLGRVASLTVADLAPQVLPSILDPTGASMVQRQLESRGVRLLLGDGAVRFEGNVAHLQSGAELPFDFLVIAVGVRPQTGLVAEAGGEVGRGIVTDERCRTTLPDVYAAGDCTESYDLASGERRVLALLPNAYMQGECAGINMAGGESRYDRAIAMNAIGFCGLHILTAGSYAGAVYEAHSDTAYKKLFTRDNRLVGFILIGDVARAGIYTALIREQTPLDTVDFELLRDRPQLMAFSRAERTKRLNEQA